MKIFQTFWFVVFTFLAWSGSAQGQYEAEFLQPLDGGSPDGVVVIPATHTVQIDENNANNVVVAEIKYTGSPAPRVTLIGGGPSGEPSPNITIREEEGKYLVEIVTSFDYERLTTNPQYVVGLNPTLPDPGVFYVQVMDVNDNRPTINCEGGSAFDINENTEENSLHEFTAEDLDSVDAGQLRFGLQDLDFSNSELSSFLIDPVSGIFSLKPGVTLDYETRTNHRLVISVADTNPDDAWKAECSVTIVTVGDLPDMPPRWLKFVSSIAVNENETVGDYEKFQYEAVDQDRGVNDTILYSVRGVPTNPEEIPFFSMDPNTGELSVAVEIDADLLESFPTIFQFDVIATEEKEPHDFVQEQVFLTIVDINDNWPSFADGSVVKTFTVSIPEGFSDRSELPLESSDGIEYSFTINDNDISPLNNQYDAKLENTEQEIQETLRVSPARGSGKGSNFSVLINDRNKIDYETAFWRQDIHLVVKVIDSNKDDFFATANVILTVININDNEPRFPDGGLPNNELIVDIPEDTKMGAIVVESLNAVDDDFNDDNYYGTQGLRYRWYNRIPSHLTLDTVTGEITVNRDNAFDFERVEEELHIVEVCDMMCDDDAAEKRSITFTLRLRIMDQNDESPTIFYPSIEPFPENQPEEIDILNGTLITITDVDTDAELEIVMDIMTETDEADLDTWFTFKSVANRTDGPEYGVSYDFTIIAEAEMVNREILDRIEFRITATDLNTKLPEFQHKRTSVVRFFATISDINDNPPYFEDITGDVLEFQYRETGVENELPDTNLEIWVFRAADLDLPTPLTFSISPHHPPMDDLVHLNQTGNRAVLYRREGIPIDREESDIIEDEEFTNWLGYHIGVFDGEHTTTIFVNITVVDINDNAPIFVDPEKNSFEIHENADHEAPGLTVGNFAATDRDIGEYGTVKFLVNSEYNGGIGADKFGIDLDTGRLFVRGELDRETVDRYTLQIRAIDNYRPGTTFGSLWEDLEITIQLLDVNDNPPRFDPDAKLDSIEENNAVIGTSFGIINVFDDDLAENAQLSFSILEVTCSNPNVEDPETMFATENVPQGSEYPTGVRIVATANFLDKFGTYTLNISAKDNGTPSLSHNQTFQLDVTDINNHAPIFVFPPADLETIYIWRGLRPGESLEYWSHSPEKEKVPPCNATDADDSSTGNGEVVYDLVTQGNEDDSDFYFNIDSNGFIFVDEPLEDRDSSDFTLTIRASDRGMPESLSAQVMIRLKLVPVVNTPPLFEANEVITINQKENDLVLEEQLPSANDQDIVDDVNAFNETICYYIAGGDNLNEFVLEVEENLLTLQIGKFLDREAIDRYDLRMCARNFPFEQCPETASCIGLNPDSYLNVTVLVDDENDESPVFETNGYGIISGGISTLADIRSLNITVLAIDRDLFDPVTYRISSGFEASDETLPGDIIPFELDRTTGKLDNVFEPQPGMRGYYRFEITAQDSWDLGPHATTVQVKIYLITDEHGVQFRFSNSLDVFGPVEKRNQLASILTEVFEHECNVERVVAAVDENGVPIGGALGRTIVHTHFINEVESEPVRSSVITSVNTNSEKMEELITKLAEMGAIFYSMGEDQNNRNPVSADKIAVYVLSGGLAVVVVILTVLGVTCWFNNRSLSRRVRALTASTFGSQQSGLNRAGATDNTLPTTNQFAVQGSNPIWTTEGNYQNFDQESVGSGGSVLIGAEDEDYFNENNNKGERSRNYASDGQSSDQIMEEEYPYSSGMPTSGRATDDMTNPLAAVSRRNPLMNFGDDDDGDDTFM